MALLVPCPELGTKKRTTFGFCFFHHCYCCLRNEELTLGQSEFEVPAGCLSENVP